MERRADPPHGCINAILPVDHRVVGPERLLDRLASHQLPGGAGEKRKNLKGLWREFNRNSGIPQFPRLEIRFEWAKTQDHLWSRPLQTFSLSYPVASLGTAASQNECGA